MRRNIWQYVLLVLLGIGFIASLRYMLTPIIVFGVIYLLYKFPPNTWRRPASGRARRHKTRNAKFRVIKGNKKSDDPPHYH